MFGEVERAVHFADEKGRPLGEGTVEFCRLYPGARNALERISSDIFFLTS